MTEAPTFKKHTRRTRKGGVVNLDDINKIKNTDKERRIKREVLKLKKNWQKKGQKADETTKKLMDFCMPLIQNLAFMTVTLEDLKEEINRDGCTVEYKNGENQYGTKKNPAVETYNTMLKNYSVIYKQVFDMIPKPEEWEKDKGDEDGFDDFIKERDET